MKSIKISQFGAALASRTEGREAALSTIAYEFKASVPTHVILDFEGVVIMTPSWLGEFVQTLQANGVKTVDYHNTSETVRSSIEFIGEETRPSGS